MGIQSSRQKRERITRDAFNALEVLEHIGNTELDGLGTDSREELMRLLEEACHYIVRLEAKSKKARLLIYDLYESAMQGEL